MRYIEKMNLPKNWKEGEDVPHAVNSEIQNRSTIDEKRLLFRSADVDQISQGETVEDAIEIEGNEDHAGKELKEAVSSASPRICKRSRIEKRMKAKIVAKSK